MNQTIINAINLKVQYGNNIIWEDASFKVEKGEFTAILGPNGAGKSTLFRALIGLIPLVNGELTILGKNPKEARSMIGYVPQRKDISAQGSLLARELIKLGFNGNKWGFSLRDKEVNSRVDEVLELVDATDLSRKSIGQLSGGELQRIFLAQALIGDPQILLLDEPLANLDLKREAELVGLITNLAHKKSISVLLIAHDLNPLSSYVDRVVYIANKHFVSGDMDQVLNAKTLSRLYNSQIEVLKDSRGRRIIVGIGGDDHHV
jgi:zinc/manganese transport system ATP-binding protein